MKYDRDQRFDADFARLPPEHRALFAAIVKQINAAYAQRGNRSIPRWPASLRIKRLQEYSGIWELTWSFSGPDGRATFEFIEVDGEMAILWRRIGGHRIYDDP